MERAEPLLPGRPENRREHRYAVEGEVFFSFDDPLRQEIAGVLKDYSKSGFRAVHNYPALVSGQVVNFQHVLSGGEARVVWNRILGGMIETGFVVLNLSVAP